METEETQRSEQPSPVPFGTETTTAMESSIGTLQDTVSSVTSSAYAMPRSAGGSVSANVSRENLHLRQAEAHASQSARSADACLGEGQHALKSASSRESKLTQVSSQTASNILSRIRTREFTPTTEASDLDVVDIRGLTCAVCLEIYSTPKFLPCHHTFCAACIEDLARRRPNKPFKCPSCRKETLLPAGGASALQHNYYIKQEDLEKASRGILDSNKCRLHPKQELDLYCVQCEKVVCFKCVLTKHRDHTMQDLIDAAKEAYPHLEEYRNKLEVHITEVMTHMERQKQELNDLESKIGAVKSNLQNRYDTVVAAAQTFLNAGLESVDKVMGEVHEAVSKDAKFAQSYFTSLCRLQKNIDAAIKTKSKVEVVEAERDMRVGYGSREAVDELLSQRMDYISRPVLHFTVYAGSVLQHVRQFFGKVWMMEMKVCESEVTVSEQFRCGDAFDTEVFSLCPKDNGHVSLSYERRRLNELAPSEGLDEKGKHNYSRKEAPGKATWKSRGKGKGLFVGQLPGQIRTYSKGQSLTSFLRLENSLAGQADIKRETIVMENPYKSKLSREFSISCGPHRAFDADVDEAIFAVVEEAKTSESFRRVLLFHKEKEDPVATYKPPTQVSQPTDICFYSLGGSSVLLVADELNDAIHVLDYQDGTLTFLKFLSPGCPLLIQPTALNVDVNNRLWVACRGGSILLIEQSSSVDCRGGSGLSSTSNETPANKSEERSGTT